MPALPVDTPPIVITASRAPEREGRSPASVTIIDDARIARLGEPLVPGLLRLVPSAAVATSGPNGSLTEVRIRGAEANHTLLFLDGIKINDPASGDTPRFELLNADLASRIEVVRGPQSALWGSDAIGGVVAVNGVDEPVLLAASAEGGSVGFRRTSASGGIRSDRFSLAGAAGWQRAEGIDSFGSPGGDRDGYRNLSGRLRAMFMPASQVKIGVSALALTGRSQFDGYNLTTFAHEDSLDSSRNWLRAGRLWGEYGDDNSPWRARIGGSLLGSSNRNLLDKEPINRTSGTRRTLDLQVERLLRTGTIEHRLIVAADTERETFHARDTVYFGATDQDRHRARQALTGEYRLTTRRVTADLALRRDHFEGFADATTLRGSLLVDVSDNLALRGAYAEGIAPPTFFDLYGVFPGNFVGNPALKPERSKGYEVGVRLRRGPLRTSLTYYRQRLQDEIVDVFDLLTFLQTSANRDRDSHRSGIEAEAALDLGERLRLSANYAFLHATQPAGDLDGRVVEARRARHSGSLAADGQSGRWSYGASIAYVGSRRDFRDNFPYDPVRLRAYWLAGARVAYALRPGIELFARGSNLLNARYQDSFGYRTEGRGLFVGLRLAGQRSSP